jgi:hypothetical protein
MTGESKGEIRIAFYTLDDLDRLIQVFTHAGKS